MPEVIENQYFVNQLLFENWFGFTKNKIDILILHKQYKLISNNTFISHFHEISKNVITFVEGKNEKPNVETGYK